MNPIQLKAESLQRWTNNPNRNPYVQYALYDVHGQYHGSFINESDAHDYVDSVSCTEAWIGDGYQVVQFR